MITKKLSMNSFYKNKFINICFLFLLKIALVIFSTQLNSDSEKSKLDLSLNVSQSSAHAR
jgi:hypothetical protein